MFPSQLYFLMRLDNLTRQHVEGNVEIGAFLFYT